MFVAYPKPIITAAGDSKSQVFRKLVQMGLDPKDYYIKHITEKD